MSQIRLLWPLTIVVLAGALSVAACQRRATPQTEAPSTFFIAAEAKNVQRRERGGIQEVTYEIDAPYPASSFLCELTQDLDQRQWRGLRMDALNPGTESSLVRGWGDHGNASRTPQTHVHGWMGQWRNQTGDLVTYGLRYEYLASAKPELTKLQVFGLIWPANLVRAQLGSRADELPALMMPSVFPDAPPPDARERSRCEQPQWSEFVKGHATETPVLALPFELAQVRTIDVQTDIEGLAGRIADILHAQVPGLRVRTVHDPVSGPSDATLDFRFECRCNEQGAPNGF